MCSSCSTNSCGDNYWWIILILAVALIWCYWSNGGLSSSCGCGCGCEEQRGCGGCCR